MYIKNVHIKKDRNSTDWFEDILKVILQSSKKLRHPVEGVWGTYKQTSQSSNKENVPMGTTTLKYIICTCVEKIKDKSYLYKTHCMECIRRHIKCSNQASHILCNCQQHKRLQNKQQNIAVITQNIRINITYVFCSLMINTYFSYTFHWTENEINHDSLTYTLVVFTNGIIVAMNMCS